MSRPFALWSWVGIVLLGGLLLAGGGPAAAQPDSRVPDAPRVPFGEGTMFLSGLNGAWVNFARDIGPGPTDLDAFDTLFRRVATNGGNSVRLWLHTNGVHTPAWGPDATVVGPGTGAIADLRAILDRAQAHDLGLVLCLWSFDMLRTALDEAVLRRNEALLRDSTRTRAYIDAALRPMVEAVADHPAVLAWEIVNEPEGMSEAYGWDFTRHVPMADLQRFINQTAGAIRRADEDALVTTGAWSFLSLSDDPDKAVRPTADAPSPEAIDRLRGRLSRNGRYDLDREAARAAYGQIAKARGRRNPYRDDRLRARGGDPMGILDFYSVHYYDWAGPGLSPFHVDAADWGLDKPIAVTEFALSETFGAPPDALYPTLLERGYAGAQAWSWTDMDPATRRAALRAMSALAETNPQAVSPDTTDRYEPRAAGNVVLRPPAPNPVRSRTVLEYELGAPGPVTLAVYDAMGRRVATLVDAWQTAVQFRVPFDAGALASGVYVCRLRAGPVVRTRRMVVIQ